LAFKVKWETKFALKNIVSYFYRKRFLKPSFFRILKLFWSLENKKMDTLNCTIMLFCACYCWQLGMTCRHPLGFFLPQTPTLCCVFYVWCQQKKEPVRCAYQKQKELNCFRVKWNVKIAVLIIWVKHQLSSF